MVEYSTRIIGIFVRYKMVHLGSLSLSIQAVELRWVCFWIYINRYIGEIC